MARAEIARWNGAPQLVIDGKPHPPMGYFMKWKDPENHLAHIRQRYDAGQRMFYLGWYLTDWAEPGVSQLLLKNCKTVLYSSAYTTSQRSIVKSLVSGRGWRYSAQKHSSTSAPALTKAMNSSNSAWIS